MPNLLAGMVAAALIQCGSDLERHTTCASLLKVCESSGVMSPPFVHEVCESLRQFTRDDRQLLRSCLVTFCEEVQLADGSSADAASSPVETVGMAGGGA